MAAYNIVHANKNQSRIKSNEVQKCSYIRFNILKATNCHLAISCVSVYTCNT